MISFPLPPERAARLLVAARNRVLASGRVLGGPGSGNFGHAGRPGERGGSAPGGGEERLNKIAAGEKFYRVDQPNDLFGHLSSSDREQYLKDFRRVPDARKAGASHQDLVDITNVVATQKSVEVQQVRELVKDASLADDPEDGPPLLIKWRDRIVIGDGHHRISAALLRGEKEAEVEFLDLDKYLKKPNRDLGGPGSGNFGHAGRPGEIGGSQTGDVDRWRQGDQEDQELNGVLMRPDPNPDFQAGINRDLYEPPLEVPKGKHVSAGVVVVCRLEINTEINTVEEV